MSKIPEWCPESVWDKARGIAAAWAMPETEYGCAAAIALALVEAERWGIERAFPILERLRHWIEDEVGAEMPFTDVEQAEFDAIRQLAEADK